MIPLFVVGIKTWRLQHQPKILSKALEQLDTLGSQKLEVLDKGGAPSQHVMGTGSLVECSLLQIMGGDSRAFSRLCLIAAICTSLRPKAKGIQKATE